MQMSGPVAYEQFDDANGLAGGAEPDGDLRRLSEVPVEASVEIGRTDMTVGETLDLRVGSVVKLDRRAGEPVDLLVNGTLIARGEVVVADEQFGLRVIEIVEGEAATAAALGAQLGELAEAVAEADDGTGAESTSPVAGSLELQATRPGER
jgi:flagellar motor switch protein FliN/FliY